MNKVARFTVTNLHATNSEAVHPPWAGLPQPVLWEVGERLHLHLAADAVRRPNPANLHPLFLHILILLRLCCCCFDHC